MRKIGPAIVVFLSVSLLALTGFIISLTNFRESVQQEFASSASFASENFRRSMADKLLLLDSMHSLYAIFDGQPQPQFRRFVLPFEESLEGVQAMQWTVPVSSDQREAFEEARRRDGVDNFEIRERDASGRLIRAQQRPVHFPIYPSLPLDEGDEFSLGFDLASSPERFQTVLAAVQNGNIAVSPRLKLLESSDNDFGIMVLKPLYRDNRFPAEQEDKLPFLSGLVLGVYRISDIFNQALRPLGSELIEYSITDLSAAPDESTLYSQSPETRLSSGSSFFSWQPAVFTESFPFANHRWQITAQPAADYMSGRHAWTAWSILIIGLLLAYTLGFYLAENIRHQEKIMENESERQSLENQLLHSQKMEAIGRLVGGIAHDFNNLLTSVIGYAELASMQNISEQTRDCLQHILQGGEKGKALIKKLLSFSRKNPEANVPQNLQPLIENTLEMLNPVMTSRIQISFTAEKTIPRVSIDPTSLDQILVNLCVNARDAVKGHGSVEISLKHRHFNNEACLTCDSSLNGDYVVLTVRDSGDGISEEQQKKIFQPFYTTKSDSDGTGLGLSIIHNIIHGCDGHILVTSKPGAGTEFRLLFPVADKDALPALRQVV